MNKYTSLLEEQDKRFKEFPIIFAFNKNQFTEGMQKLNVESATELVSIGAGGIIRKTDLADFRKMLTTFEQEKNRARLDDEYVLEMFRYELDNHEWPIAQDIEPVLMACGLSEKEVYEDARLSEILADAKIDCMRWFNMHN